VGLSGTGWKVCDVCRLWLLADERAMEGAVSDFLAGISK
jgi:hypothetical protein